MIADNFKVFLFTNNGIDRFIIKWSNMFVTSV